MDKTEDSTTAKISSVSSFAAAKSSPLTSNIKKRGKLKKKGKSLGSKSGALAPDLDIVSGFAFLSFSNLGELECHIEEHEIKTRSLSINVGQKRKIQPKGDENAASVRSVSKRIKIPSQKILESYATNDIPLNKLVPAQDSHSKAFSGEKVTSSNLHIKTELSPEKMSIASSSLAFPNREKLLECNSADTCISLECSETIDVCSFDDEDGKKSLPSNHSNAEKSREKKHKKKKRDKGNNDQTCQTMFRIKKKKKKKLSSNMVGSKHVSSAVSSTMTANLQANESVAITSQENNTTDIPDCVLIDEVSDSAEVPSVGIKEEKKEYSPTEQYQLMQATKYFDSKFPRHRISNKVEKIDYCARSGGVNLVERHHERQAKLKDSDSASYASCSQQFPQDKDSQDSFDTSIQSDNLSDNSGNESSCNSSVLEQDGLLSSKKRIFAGSTSVFVSSVQDTNDESEVNVDGDDEGDSTFLPINIVKALPKNYLFGHFSTYPDKSTSGTVDVNIQIYENDIQLYMNYASEFDGNTIKIITPDTEYTSKNTNSCLPHSASFSGVPKFLQPQEYVKAVRSATERNRRHNLGDLFNQLKDEIFDEVREFYFSKQAILSKAIEVINTTDQQNIDLIQEKKKLSATNQELRTSLKGILFGEDVDCSKDIDLDKVTEYLKTMDIEIEVPDIGAKGEADNMENTSQSSDAAKNVAKRGRPPLEGKFLVKIPAPRLVEPQCEQHELSKNMNAVINNKVKGFIAIAPQDTENKATPVERAEPEVAVGDEIKLTAVEPKQEHVMDTPVSKIVCNISRYRLQQTGGTTRYSPFDRIDWTVLLTLILECTSSVWMAVKIEVWCQGSDLLGLVENEECGVRSAECGVTLENHGVVDSAFSTKVENAES
ncbi:hypothetical protein QZH41_006152 [Actinostola sp. cb2023]|nr:hypothetical protein QZH41_006152 [Actinostola sp. cb2023]